MKEKIRNILCSLPVLLVLPYLMVIIVNGAEQALTVHTFDPEEWIACMLEGQIPAGYETEAVKAQLQEPIFMMKRMRAEVCVIL